MMYAGQCWRTLKLKERTLSHEWQQEYKERSESQHRCSEVMWPHEMAKPISTNHRTLTVGVEPKEGGSMVHNLECVNFDVFAVPVHRVQILAQAKEQRFFLVFLWYVPYASPVGGLLGALLVYLESCPLNNEWQGIESLENDRRRCLCKMPNHIQVWLMSHGRTCAVK